MSILGLILTISIILYLIGGVMGIWIYCITKKHNKELDKINL